MYPAGKKLCRVAMAKIMKLDPRQFLQAAHEAGELVGQAKRLVWLAVGSAAKQGVGRLSNAKSQQSLGLLTLEPAGRHRRGG
jgi:hypothetical protein